MASQTFALIIGINKYKNEKIYNLHGCVRDAQATSRWLTHDLRVPPQNICILLDKQATQKAIEEAFESHLLNNVDIQRGDTIIFYFAGHGSSMPAPRHWYDGQDRISETLCPHDYDMFASEGGRTAGLSDRSLLAMLGDLRAAKGSNITVILDACFSPVDNDMTPQQRRSIRWTPTNFAGFTDLENGVWQSTRPRPKTGSQYGGFCQEAIDSHILLAACAVRQVAVEDQRGGVFTTALLEVLRRNPLHSTSYTELIDALPDLGPMQEPQCVGKNAKRLLFSGKPFGTNAQYIAVTFDEQKRLRVEAGAIHGVVVGTEFTVHAHNRHGSWNPVVSVLVACEVHSTWCRARYKTAQRRIEAQGWALVTNWNRRTPFRVCLTRTFPSCLRWWKWVKSIPSSSNGSPSQSGLQVVRVRRRKDADMAATLGKRAPLIERLDNLSRAPRLLHSSIEHPDELGILDDAARFHMHLSRENPDDSLKNQVTMELYRLDTDSWAPYGRNLLAGSSGAARIPYEPDTLYCVKLRNNSDKSLWPYLAYMDPHDYTISKVYQSDSPSMAPPLRARAEMVVGAGTAGSEALSFSLGEHESSARGYLKLFLSTTHANMAMLEQTHAAPPEAALDQGRKSRRGSTASTVEPEQDLWTVVTAPVSIVRGKS